MKHFIMPYACGVDRAGMPDAEAKARLDKALAVARRKCERGLDVIIFLGAGMPERTRKYGYASSAESATVYLQDAGWPAERIVQRPKGFRTTVETFAFYQYLHELGDQEYTLEVVSSWVHIARVWMICRIVFGSSVRISISRSGFRGKTLLEMLLREVVAIPHSFLLTITNFPAAFSNKA